MSSCNIPPCTPAHPLAGLPPRVPLDGTIAGTMETSSHGVLEHGGAHGRCADAPQSLKKQEIVDTSTAEKTPPMFSRKRKAQPLESTELKKYKCISLREITDVQPVNTLKAPEQSMPVERNLAWEAAIHLTEAFKSENWDWVNKWMKDSKSFEGIIQERAFSRYAGIMRNLKRKEPCMSLVHRGIQVEKARAQQKVAAIRKLMYEHCPTWRTATSHLY